MQSQLTFLEPNEVSFPPADHALSQPNGLLAVGGDLRPERLKQAYYQGIFPWFSEDDPLLWWSPNPRAVIEVGQLHISRSLHKDLRKQINKHGWRFTINHAFADVIYACAAQRLDAEGTWISPEIQSAYCLLHLENRAHSIEVWQAEKLIGGLYGINVGGVFCGESMFHRQTNASKAAMVILEQHLMQYGYQLIDAQIMNPHLHSLGAKAISRREFLTQLYQYRDQSVAMDCWQKQEVFFEY